MMTHPSIWRHYISKWQSITACTTETGDRLIFIDTLALAGFRLKCVDVAELVYIGGEGQQTSIIA